tara:strand:+ start:14098 stop:14211 length:114 start_codon:yes stop_codon:yes gene_type:complete
MARYTLDRKIGNNKSVNVARKEWLAYIKEGYKYIEED